MQAYQKTIRQVMEEYDTHPNGLLAEEVKHRQERDGFNEWEQQERESALKLFLLTFKDPMMVVLLLVAAIQLLLGKTLESLVIVAVLLINGLLSVVQTKKAEDALQALQNLAAPTAKVIREGGNMNIPAKEVVLGDVVLLDAGDHVPADGRLMETNTLQIDESMLTGESLPSQKNTAVIPTEAPLGDRVNMVFSGSLVTYGRGQFIVTAIAKETEIGKVAGLIRDADASKQTPLQRKLEVFSKKLGVAILLLSVLIFAVKAARIILGEAPAMREELLDAFVFAVAVAVAAIPEALQSIITVVLSVGTSRLAKKNAIIRKLPAVETLGSTSIICTDKTGTLTQNKMTVVESYLPFGQTGAWNPAPGTWPLAEKRLLQVAVLANDAAFDEKGHPIGDATEAALIVYSNKLHQPYDELRKRYPRMAELPFDSERKLMSTVHVIDREVLLLVKGAPDIIFKRSSRILLEGEVQELMEEHLHALEKQNEAFSDRALRVLAFAYKPLEEVRKVSHEEERDLIFVGLMAMMDPPREGVYGAIEEAIAAGIKTVMITGDHKSTARAIARELNIYQEGDVVVTGQELDAFSDEELLHEVERISVYARVTPENKIRIVKAWQEKDRVCAMTGDGVNDAPALKQADVGIAMGSGTDVAKDSAAMILTDDNFASIVNAISVGRNIYNNIKKAIAYLFSGNLGAVIAIIAALLLNWVVPLTALQILFINLMNDSLPAIALSMEPSEPDVMKQKPRDPDERIFAGGTLASVLFRGTVIAIAVIASQAIGLQHSTDMSVAMAFTTLILARTLQVFPARSNSQTVIQADFLGNKYVLYAVLFCLGLYALTLTPPLRPLFNIPAAFGFLHWLIAAALAVASVVVMELKKSFFQRGTPDLNSSNDVNKRKS